MVLTTELHGAPHSSAGAGPPLCSGVGVGTFWISIYFAMFSFLYRGFAVVVFLSALIHCLTKSLSAVPTAAMMRRTPKKTTGPANHIAYNPRKPQRGFFWTFVVFALTYNYISSSCGFFCVSVVPRRCHLITNTYLWYWIQLVVFFFLLFRCLFRNHAKT